MAITKPVTVDLDALTVGDLEALEQLQAKERMSVADMVAVIPRLVCDWTAEDVRALKVSELKQVMNALSSALGGAVPPPTGAR